VADVVFGLLFECGFEAAFVVARGDRKVVSANVRFEELVGRRVVDLVGQPLEQLLATEGERHGPDIVDHAGHYEDVAIHGSDGYPRYVELTVAHVHHPELGPLAACLARDTTDRLELERDLLAKHSALHAAHGELQRLVIELRAAQRQIEERNVEISVLAGQVSRVGWRAAIGELAAGLAHHLNNPVGALNSTLRTLQQRLGEHPGRADIEPLVTRAIGVAGRIEEHVAAVVRLHRAGALDSEPRWLDLGRELDTALSMFAGRMSGITVMRGYSESLSAHVPQEPLHHVVGSVIDNAVLAMPKGGELGLSVARDGDAWVIAVDDSGPGVSAALAPRLFESAGSIGSAGLGLATAQRLARLWGGDLVHKPRTRGARFEITVPASERAPAPAKEQLR